MSPLFDEIKDPAERKQKLIENGQLICQQARESLARVIDGREVIDQDAVGALFNTFGFLGSSLRVIGELEGIKD